ncbi:MAG: RNA polymerase sigma factor [Candidatus Izemoplasmataceae bacterium]
MPSKSQIKQLKHKNQEAFEAIYHETKHAVYAMILPIVKDRSLAEDIMQDTYIKMIERIHSYNPKYKFINWLLTIAKNQALDVYRRRSKEVPLTDAWLDTLPNMTSSIEKRLQAEYYLKILTDEERRIVLLKVVADLTHKDIAYQLGKPLGTVTWIYQEAIKKMRKASEVNQDEK